MLGYSSKDIRSTLPFDLSTKSSTDHLKAAIFPKMELFYGNIRCCQETRRQAQGVPALRDVATDQQDHGWRSTSSSIGDTASRLGITATAIDNTLYDAFGQRQVSTMFTQLNQYHVVLEVAPEFQRNPRRARRHLCKSGNGRQVPLSAFTHFETGDRAAGGQSPGPVPGGHDFVQSGAGRIRWATRSQRSTMRAKQNRHAGQHPGRFQGTAAAFQSVAEPTKPLLILAALVTVYIVLGVLYESYIHPITILSTLPSAGVGAMLALLICCIRISSVIALIGIILLIGIVKKNAIMMIDFALEAERKEGKPPHDAIYQACLLRFRPIMMTTMAALLGGCRWRSAPAPAPSCAARSASPSSAACSFSQVLTLYTTPVSISASTGWRTRFAGADRSTRPIRAAQRRRS